MQMYVFSMKTISKFMPRIVLLVGIFFFIPNHPAHAQANRPLVWDLQRMSQLSGESIRLNGKDGKEIRSIPRSRTILLMSVKEKIESIAGITTKFMLMEGASPNAFSTRDKSGTAIIGINFAMIDMVGDDQDAYAAIIGHEYAHLTLQHGDTRKSREGVRTGLATVLGFILGRAGIPMGGTIADLTTSAVSRVYSRDEERDADRTGIDFAARAGYSAEGGIRVWEKMASKAGASIPFLATHPASAERVENMRVLARAYLQATQVATASPPSAESKNSESTLIETQTPPAMPPVQTIARVELSVPLPIVWTRFCNSGRLSHGVSLADFKG